MTQSFDPTTLSVKQAADLVAIRAAVGYSRSQLEKQADLGGAATGAMVGGGLGLGAGLLSSAMSRSRNKKWLRNALLGSLLGAGTGGAIGSIGPMAEMFRKQTPEQTTLAKLQAESAAAKANQPTRAVADPLSGPWNWAKKQVLSATSPATSNASGAIGDNTAVTGQDATSLVDANGVPTAAARQQAIDAGIPEAAIDAIGKPTATDAAGDLLNEYTGRPGMTAATTTAGGVLGHLYDRARANDFRSMPQRVRMLSDEQMKKMSPEAQADARRVQGAFRAGGKQPSGMPYPTFTDVKIGPFQGPPVPTGIHMESRNQVKVPGSTPVKVSPQLSREMKYNFNKPMGVLRPGLGMLIGGAAQPLITRMIGGGYTQPSSTP